MGLCEMRALDTQGTPRNLSYLTLNNFENTFLYKLYIRCMYINPAIAFEGTVYQCRFIIATVRFDMVCKI